MASSVLHLTLPLIIFSSVLSQISASVDLEELSKTVAGHTATLKEFPVHVGNVKALEKQLEDYEPRLTVLEAHTRNLQSDVNDLTSVSIFYTERLDNFVTYQKKSDKLDSDVAQLTETVSKNGESLKALEVYTKRTNKLEDHIIDINDELQNNSAILNKVSKDVGNFQTTCLTEQKNTAIEVKKINALQEEQQKTSRTLNDFIHNVDVKKNETSRTFSALQETCVAEQLALKTKVQKLDSIVKVQDDTKNKLSNLVTNVEKQKTSAKQSLETLQGSLTAQKNQMQAELQKIDPLTKTQDTTTKKLGELVTSLNQLKNEQQTLQKSLKQLKDQFDEFIRGQTTPATTLATTTTQDPGSQPVVIRKHIHARGNNIIVTI